MPRLRAATHDDATAWADIVASCSPYLVQDAASTAYEMTTEGPDTQRLVTEVDGEILGISRLRADPGEDHVSLMVMVRPEQRRLGLGRALLDAQLEAAVRIGRVMVTCIVEDDEEARIACTRWGFAMTRSFRMSMVDPRSIPEPPAPPDGTSVAPLTALGPRVVWRAHAAVVGDDPSGLSLALPYDEFLVHEWADPRMRPDLGRAVLVDGELASFTMMGAASDRAWSDMTGTLPAHRGHGLRPAGEVARPARRRNSRHHPRDRRQRRCQHPDGDDQRPLGLPVLRESIAGPAAGRAGVRRRYFFC